MFHLIPTKAQWREWSLPSKLTCIGAGLGVVSIVLTVTFFVWPMLPTAKKSKPDNDVRTEGQKVQPNADIRKDSVFNVQMLDMEANSIEVLRASHGLRELTQFESGKSLSEVPSGTFFFIQTHALEWNSAESFDAKADRIKARRFYDPILKAIFFEAHKLTSGEIYLLAYTTTETASSISTLDGKTEKRCIAYNALKTEFDKLLYLPLFRIVESSNREMDFDDHTSEEILELTLK
jgi:hypothetical protein